MKKTTVKIYKAINQLPDNDFTQPIKEKVSEKLSEELSSVKQEIIRANWDLASLYHVLKQMSEDPDIPESKREEIKKSVQEYSEKIRVIQEKIEKKLNQQEKPQ